MHVTPDQIGQRTFDSAGASPAEEFSLLFTSDGPVPDVFAFLAAKDEVSADSLLDVIRLDQVRRWARGQPLRAEQYLSHLPALERDEESALQVIYHEYVVRQEQGEDPAVEEYQTRFPHFADALRRQIELDQVLGRLTTAPASDTICEDAGEELSPPCRLGRYFLVQQLGEGGQAQVFRAIHPVLGRDVVIKLAQKRAVWSPGLREHLLIEGRALAELNHPNLARIYDLDLYKGRPMLVLEFVRGRDLVQYTRTGPLPPRRAALIIATLARALAVVHRRGLLHRDIKPTNVLMDESDRPVLIDFGLARCVDAWHPGTGEIGLEGTPAFMAPEQANQDQEHIGPPVDIFGLGALLYFLLTGEPPFAAGDVLASLSRAREDNWNANHPKFLAAPPRLRAACLRALAARPSDRHASAEELAKDLEGFASDRRLAWRSVSVGLAACLVVCLLLAFWSLLPHWSTPRSNATPPAASFAGPSLALGIWRGERFSELPAPGGTRANEHLEALVDLPAAFAGALIVRDTRGNWSQATHWPVAPVARVRHGGISAENLAGSPPRPGIAVIVLCVGPSTPRLADVRRAWDEAGSYEFNGSGAWLFRVTAQRVVLEQSISSTVPNESWERLETFRHNLSRRTTFVAVVLPLLPPEQAFPR